MRRSGAPSQRLTGNLAKKPRFVSPLKVHSYSDKTAEIVTTTLKPKNGAVPFGALERTSDVNTNSTTIEETILSAAPAHTFAVTAASKFKPVTAPLHVINQDTQPRNEEEGASCHVTYFGVVWCKASKKKHKKWEGDAVLITRGRSVTLKDMEGKDIGRGSGYKLKDLENLDEGHTLMIGGKEIEVMGKISAEDYSSGRCFHAAGIAPTQTPSDFIHLKPFSNPFKNGSNKEAISRELQICKPRHDPSLPNSIVMPKPSLHHQQLFNKSGLSIVDVVVDPYVAVHLRPHQRDGILFLYECIMGMRVNDQFGAILADEMGLGKTLQCISLIWTLLRQGPYGGKPLLKRALIVTPGSLVKNWRKEFQKWLGTERMRVFAVDQDHKVEEFISSPLYSVLIISYEMLLRSLEQIQSLGFDIIICDEGHRLKNSSIKTTSALSSLSCSKRIILSGTPVQNDLQEFHALIDFVNPGILGSSSSYKKIYEEPIIRSREPSASKEEKKLGDERASELARLTGLFILRRTQEVINKFLPPKIESIVFCKPSFFQLDVYRKLLNSRLVKSCLQGFGESSPHLVCIGALKKLCNHPCLLFKTIQEKSTNLDTEERSLYESLVQLFPHDYNAGKLSESESGKLQVLTKLLSAIREHSPSERVVLVSNYTQTLNILQDVCQQRGYKCTRLDGQTPVTHRQQIVDGFNSKYSPDFIFLLSSKAGGVGLNLIGASHLILYDIDWNPANDIQAMARVWRDGQKHTVRIYRLLTTGSIEEKIYQRQISKQGLSGAVVDLAKKSEHIRFSVDELRDLFSLHEESDCITHDLLDCDCLQAKHHSDNPAEKQLMPSSCQLGTHTAKPDKNISMSELMQWKHFSTQQRLDDPYLLPGREDISFVFQSTTNSQTTANMPGNREYWTGFLEIYQANECLWNLQMKEYSDRGLKHKGYVKLQEYCKALNKNVTIAWVKQKINNFRTTFMREHTKYENAKRSGAGADEVKKPTLWYYDILSFVLTREAETQSVSSLKAAVEVTTPIEVAETEDSLRPTEEVDPEPPTSELTKLEASIVEAPATTPQPQPVAKRRRLADKGAQASSSRPDRAERFLTRAEEVLQTNSDDLTVFGINMGNELRNMKPRTQFLCRRLIYGLIQRGMTDEVDETTTISPYIPQQSIPTEISTSHLLTPNPPIPPPQMSPRSASGSPPSPSNLPGPSSIGLHSAVGSALATLAHDDFFDA